MQLNAVYKLNASFERNTPGKNTCETFQKYQKHEKTELAAATESKTSTLSDHVNSRAQTVSEAVTHAFWLVDVSTEAIRI